MGSFGEETYFSLKYSSGGDTPDITFWVRLKLVNEIPLFWHLKFISYSLMVIYSHVIKFVSKLYVCWNSSLYVRYWNDIVWGEHV